MHTLLPSTDRRGFPVALSRPSLFLLALCAALVAGGCGSNTGASQPPPARVKVLAAVQGTARPDPSASALGEPSWVDPLVGEIADAEPADSTDERELDQPVSLTADDGPWLGRPAGELRVRIYARSKASTVLERAEALALRLELAGFRAKVVPPDVWRPERDSRWLGDHTLAELAQDEDENLVILPPGCPSAARLLRRNLGPGFQFETRAASSMQRQQEGEPADTVIDVLPKRGGLTKL